MKDIEYSVLKQNQRAYNIMLLRDQYGNTFYDIAKEYEISPARVMQIYHRLKVKQIHLYINHIAIVYGHRDTSLIRKVYQAAYECYQDLPYACAYMENKYKTILIQYRDGEPGMPAKFIKGMPPFKSKLSKKEIAHIIEMRDMGKVTFVAIAKELRITQAKAKYTYDMFYHKRTMELIKTLQDQMESKEEKDALMEYYFRKHRSSKMRYNMLTRGGDVLSPAADMQGHTEK